MTFELPWTVAVHDFATAVLVISLGVFLFYGTLNLLLEARFRPTPPISKRPNPERVAILVPVKDDPSILNAVSYLKAIEYPNFDVIILDDSDDPTFRERLDGFGEAPVRVVRRESCKGRKGGALNFGLRFLSLEPPKYVVILDADHRPPPDFLAKAVTLIEQTHAQCVCGYQKHDIGSNGFFGLFYRASSAVAFRNLKARSDLGFGAFFPGAAAIFEYEWLRSQGFDETSVTEDWELSFRALSEGEFRIVVHEGLWVSAAVPQNLGTLLLQLVRWVGGTTRDFRKHAIRLLLSRQSMVAKVGMYSQGLMGLPSLAFLLFWILPLLFPVGLSAISSSALLAFLGAAWGWPLYRASRSEGYSLRQVAAVLAYGLVCAYVLAPAAAYAFVLGLVRDPIHGRVTKRRG